MIERWLAQLLVAPAGQGVQLNYWNISVFSDVAVKRWLDRVSVGLRAGIGGEGVKEGGFRDGMRLFG